jgi:hypothetical protein
MALEELMLVNPKGKYPRRKSLQIVFPKPVKHMKVNPSAIDRVKEAGKGLMGDVTLKEVAGGVGGVASTVLIPQYLKLKGWKGLYRFYLKPKSLNSQCTYVDFMFLPLNDKQFEFWRLRRSGLLNINIACSFNISKQAVSKALITMDERIEKTLLEMARANQIEMEKVNSERGILFGRSVPFNVNAIIFVSAKHGVQVWYDHEGDCGACARYTQCIELLWDFADEMKFKLERTDDPTKLAEELFEELRRLT